MRAIVFLVVIVYYIFSVNVFKWPMNFCLKIIENKSKPLGLQRSNLTTAVIEENIEIAYIELQFKNIFSKGLLKCEIVIMKKMMIINAPFLAAKIHVSVSHVSIIK